MVKVVKRDKSVQAFSTAKVVKACKGSGVPEPIAKAIAGMIASKIKARKQVTSIEIRKMVLEILEKVGSCKKAWLAYKKKV